MKAKIKTAYNTRTGKTMAEGDFNVLVDLCTGIILEIIEGAEVEVEVTGGSSAGTYTGEIKA